jgi:hypothetical protein
MSTEEAPASSKSLKLTEEAHPTKSLKLITIDEAIYLARESRIEWARMAIENNRKHQRLREEQYQEAIYDFIEKYKDALINSFASQTDDTSKPHRIAVVVRIKFGEQLTYRDADELVDTLNDLLKENNQHIKKYSLAYRGICHYEIESIEPRVTTQ